MFVSRFSSRFARNSWTVASRSTSGHRDRAALATWICAAAGSARGDRRCPRGDVFGRNRARRPPRRAASTASRTSRCSSEFGKRHLFETRRDPATASPEVEEGTALRARARLAFAPWGAGARTGHLPPRRPRARDAARRAVLGPRSARGTICRSTGATRCGRCATRRLSVETARTRFVTRHFASSRTPRTKACPRQRRWTRKKPPRTC